MTRRNFLANALKTFAAAQFAPAAISGANVSGAASAIAETAGIGIGEGTTLGQAIFWLNSAAVDNVYRIRESIPMDQKQTDFYLRNISSNPHTEALLNNYTPSELYQAFKESVCGEGLPKNPPLSDEKVVEDLAKVIKQVKEYKKEESSAKKQEENRSSSTPPNWVRFEPMDYTQLYERSRELDGSGYYSR